jgi:uncharacterized RDD family membrane protein YckC
VLPVEERGAATVPVGLELASFGRRAIGTLLDQILVMFPVVMAAVVVGIRPGDELGEDTVLVLGLAMVAVAFGYETVLVALTGRTVGKVATGTRVVRSDDGEAVGWFAAAQRSVVPLAFSSVPTLGLLLGGLVYAWAFVDPRRQGLHDKAAGTLVVRAGGTPDADR